MWWKKKSTRKELEEDAKEDLELGGEDADKVAGGALPIKLDSTTSTDSASKF